MKDDKTIKPIPDLPSEVLDAAKQGELAIFVGAGVSRIYGCDSWIELAERLSKACYDKEKITFREQEHLLSECKTNSKKIITICKNILKKENYEDHEYEDYVEILKQGLKIKKELDDNENFYKYMHRLSAIGASLYVTTNLDNLLSNYLERRFSNIFDKSKIKCHENDFNEKPNTECLYHIHGYIDEPDSLVLTVSEYSNRYKNSNYIEFLKKIFMGEYTVLFLGYGLRELELLEYIVTKGDKKIKNKYLLLPFRDGDESRLDIEEKYFEDLSIKLVPFKRDKKDYKQLEKVIKAWSEEISQRSKVLVKNYNEIEQLVKSYTPENVEKILRLISNDKLREDYFFEYISKIDNPLDWLQFVYCNGYTKPDKVPGPKKDDSDGMYWMPWWNALKYLNAIAENAEKIDDEKSKLLTQIIEEHFTYFKKKKHDRTSINQRIENCLFRLIISLPVDKITKESVKYIRFLLESVWHNYSSDQISDILLPKLIKAKKKDVVIEFFKVAVAYKKQDDSNELVPLLGQSSTQLRKLIDKNLERLCPEYAFECVKILIDKIAEINDRCGDTYQFSVFNINDITSIGSLSGDDYEKQLVYATVSLVREIGKKLEVEQLIDTLEKEHHPIFNRIKYCVFSDHFKKFPELIWKYVENDQPIKRDDSKRERYLFLKNNAEYFNEKQIDKILEWIKKLDVSYADQDETQKLLDDAIEKKEWLSALAAVKNEKVKKLYDEYNKINPNNRPNPGHYAYYYSFDGVKPLPSYVKKWRELSVEDIIKNIKRIKINNTDESGNIIYEDDLAREIKQWTINDPKKYADRIQMFIKNDLYLYLIHIIRGVSASEVRLDDKTWDKFFDDIHSYVGTKHVWSNKPSTEEEYYPIGFLISTMRLIKKLVKNKKLSNKQKQNQTIKKILLVSLERCESTLGYDKVETDIISHFCNSLLGGILECSLEWMNTNPTKDGDDKWDEDFKKIFEKKLNEEKRAREFSVALGQMMPYLSYHCKENIDKILPEDDKDLRWKDTMVSILLSSNIIYKKLYNILRDKKHYRKALKTKFYSQDVTKSVINHICFGYLEFQDDDTIKELIESEKHSNIKHAINFFKVIKTKIDSKKRKKLKKFWEDVHNTYKEKKGKESKDVLCRLATLQTHFDKLYDNKDLLKASFQNAKFSDYSYSLLELLLKYVDNEPGIVAELMLETVKAGFCFYYQRKRLRTIVEKLYEHGLKDEADKICIHYLRKENYDLKDIYDKYNKDDNNGKTD